MPADTYINHIEALDSISFSWAESASPGAIGVLALPFLDADRQAALNSPKINTATQHHG